MGTLVRKHVSLTCINILFSPRVTFFDLFRGSKVPNLSCSIVVKSLDGLYFGKGMKILKFLKIHIHRGEF